MKGEEKKGERGEGRRDSNLGFTFKERGRVCDGFKESNNGLCRRSLIIASYSKALSHIDRSEQEELSSIQHEDGNRSKKYYHFDSKRPF